MNMLESVNVRFIAVIISGFKSAGKFCTFVYYRYLCFSVKTDTTLFVVMQNHLFSWIIKPGPVRAGRPWWQWNLFDIVACFYEQIMFMLHFFCFYPSYLFYYKNVFLYELVLYNPSNLPFRVFPCFALTVPLSSMYHFWVPAVCIMLCRT